MTTTPIHDWLRPRLEALMQDGYREGFDPDKLLATLIDLADSEDFAPATPDASKPE